MVPDVDAGASPSLKPSLGRFALAALLAALAGAIAAFVMTVGFRLIERDTLLEAAHGSLVMAMIAFAICAVYVIGLGTAVMIYMRVTGRAPALRTAMVVALLSGPAPWCLLLILEQSAAEGLVVAVVATVCGLATAWTFWRVAIAAPP